MDAGTDFDDLMRWNDRLQLLAQVQGSYLELLRDKGFDSEQAFTLVRDWSNRSFDWTMRDDQRSASWADNLISELQFPRRELLDDPSVATSDEPYLIEPDGESTSGDVIDLDDRRAGRDGRDQAA